MAKRTRKAISGEVGDDRSATVSSQIRIARKKAGLTEKQLAQKIGVTQSYISKLERNVIPLKPKIADKIAEHVPARPPELLGYADDGTVPSADARAPGLQEKGEAFVADGGGASSQPAAPGKPRKLSPFTLKTDDLAALGYPRGTVLVVDFEPPSADRLADGTLVIVEVTARGKARRLARQFVAPDLLCCNSGRSSGPVMRTGDAGVTIVGIIYGELDEAPSRKPSVKRRRKPG